MLIKDPVTLTLAIRELVFMKNIERKIGLSLNLSLFPAHFPILNSSLPFVSWLTCAWFDMLKTVSNSWISGPEWSLLRLSVGNSRMAQHLKQHRQTVGHCMDAAKLSLQRAPTKNHRVIPQNGWTWHNKSWLTFQCEWCNSGFLVIIDTEYKLSAWYFLSHSIR